MVTVILVLVVVLVVVVVVVVVAAAVVAVVVGGGVFGFVDLGSSILGGYLAPNAFFCCANQRRLRSAGAKLCKRAGCSCLVHARISVELLI